MLLLTFLMASAAETKNPQHYDVEENGLCLFGHWVTGAVSVVLEGEEVTINGIRIIPSSTLLSCATAISGPSTAKGHLTQELYHLQKSLFADKASQEFVTLRSLELLNNSDLVESVVKLKGVVYRIHWSDGGATVVNIGADPGSDQESTADEVKADVFFDKLCGWLRQQKVVIITSGGIVVLPAKMNTDPEFLEEVGKARNAAIKWDVESWGSARFFPSIVAEELRVPLDLSSRERAR